MNEYFFQKATLKDIAFLAEVIIEAEKSMTDNLGLATLFELSEEKVKELIISMLEEEIDGCEFSISSFFVAYYEERPIAALGGWMEGYYDDMPSSLLKANLISVTFPKENILKAQNKIKIISDVQIEREMGTYQLEYGKVDSEHRGNRLMQRLMKVHLDYAKKLQPDVKKAQLQIFENNEIIRRVHEGFGYQIIRRFVSNDKEIFNYLPYNVKLLMEKTL